MPAAGRPDSKYVHRIHYRTYVGSSPLRAQTRCGKSVIWVFTTRDSSKVTCKTCLLIFDIPVGDIDD